MVKMKATEQGFDLIIKRLDELTDIGFKECAKPALKKTAERVKNDMVSAAPVSTRRDIHGRDAINTSSMRIGKYNLYMDVGFSSNMRGHGSDYWTQVRGLWFQEYKTDEPNFGWYTKAVKSNQNSYKALLEDEFLFQVRRYFNIFK